MNLRIGTKPGCLTSFEVAALATDLLSPDEAQAAFAHVANCASCSAALQRALDDLGRPLTPSEQEFVTKSLGPMARPVDGVGRTRATSPRMWLAAAAAMVIVAAGLGYVVFSGDPVPSLLAQASGPARPSEFRLPGAQHGEVSTQRGPEANPPAALLQAQAALAKRAGDRNAEFLRLQAWSELLIHQDGTAIRTLEEARRLAPNNLDVVGMLGAAYAARAREGAGSEAGFRSALAAFTQVLTARPEDRAARFNRGLVYYHLQQPAAAIEDWQALLRVEKDEAWATEVRALLRGAQAKMR